MAEIGAYEAKTHLPKLLERVEKGERFVITRHGRPIAQLTPISDRNEAGIRLALAEIRAIRSGLLRRGIRLKDLMQPGESVRDLAHEGHRF